MQFELIPHCAFPPTAVRSVSVELTATDWCDVLIDYTVEGGNVVVGEPRSPGRSDDLWKSTCFELFVKMPDSEAYFEFNFAPSSLWAAYRFDGYREGMTELKMAVEPQVERETEHPLKILADLDLSEMPPTELIANLAAVIEETNGTKSYWALAHPAGPPDFHDPSCFVARLPE